MSRSIHPGAHVDPGAELADDVSVGPGSVVESGVVIGEGTRVGPHAVLMDGTEVGREVRIHTGAVIGDEPQDVKFEGGRSRVRIGDRAVLREYATVHRCTEPGAVTRVGVGVMLMAYSHVAHECTVGEEVVLANGVQLAGHVDLGDGAFLSGNVVVHQFVRVGRLAMVGGDSKVVQDIPPYCLADGHPARLVGLNLVGMRRAGVDRGVIRALKEAYRVLFRSGLPRREAVEKVRAAEAGEVQEVARLVEFLDGGERGIAPARSRSRGNDGGGGRDRVRTRS